jgi:NADH-quinone oxidoreductase subunit J
MGDVVFAVIFYAFAVMVLVSAIAAAFLRNIVMAAFALFFTLLGMAGFYVLLGADFLAITQVVVYVGGILILLLFGVLLTHRTIETLELETRGTYVLGILGGLLLYGVLHYFLFSASWPLPLVKPLEPTTAGIGQLLLNKYLLPFEVSSLTLLIALIGAAYLVRRRDT